MSGLPHSWAATTFGEVTRIVSGGTPPSKDETNFSACGGIPWVTPADLSGHRSMYISTGARNLSEKGYAACSAAVLPAGSVLFSSRAPIGYVAIAANEISTNQGFKSFVLPEGIDNRFTYYYLKHIKPVAEQMATGTTFKELSGSGAARLPLRIAPFAEQKRIADKLDAVLARVDACRDRLDRLPALLKRFRQSILAAATSGRLTEDWRATTDIEEPAQLTLKDVLKVSSGSFLPAKDMAPGGTVPVFGGNGINGYHDTSNVAEETLVIGRVGYYCGSVHLTPSSAWVTDNALIVRHDERTNRKYLFYALHAIDLRANDSSTAQPVISGQKIYPLSVTVPHIREQEEIVRRVDTLFAFADRLEARLAAARRQVGQLTPALLAKAFRGELVPQDPADEPASELLKRLAAQRESAAPTKRGRRQVRAVDPG